MKDIPRAELIKQFSKEYTKLKEENERIFAKNPWAGKASANIKKEFEADEAAAREKYPEVFYYYDGLLDVAISQSMHPAVLWQALLPSEITTVRSSLTVRKSCRLTWSVCMRSVWSSMTFSD